MNEDIVVVEIDEEICLVIIDKCEKMLLGGKESFILVKILLRKLEKGDIVYKRGVKIKFIIGIVKFVKNIGV